MLSFIYNLIVQPLVLVIEVIFVIMYRLLRNAGLAIVGVSLVVNFLILPLYRRADEVQEAERNKQASMKHWVDHIKKTFRGDERYMMLQAYYRQQDYHPLYALKSSISLLLQIPFFIAAYRFLSDLSLLSGASFGPIPDLSRPDGLLTVGGITLNLLPLLMTAVNLLSGAVYSRGFPISSKIQQVALTLLFLVLLYDRPAGLVMYWTLNNIFSLVKNIFYKVLKHPEEIFAALAGGFGIAFFGYMYLRGKLWSTGRKAVVGAVLVVCLLPLARLIFARVVPKKEKAGQKEEKLPIHYFLLGGIFLTLLIGFIIPEAIISDSPLEFVDQMAYRNPIRFAVGSAVITAGFFLVWGNVFYALAADRVKKVFAGFYWGLSVTTVINYMFFGRHLGDISTELVFDELPSYTRRETLLNLALVLLAAAVCYLVWRLRRKLIPSVYIIGSLGLAGLGATQFSTMQKGIAEASYLVPAKTIVKNEVEPLFRLSRTGQNVVVLMLDKAIGSYLPYILKEKPELAVQLDGFTWYRNSISYGQKTNMGSPALYGGYEYVPVEINRRSDELLKDKQNEALKVMPVLFREKGYEVTVCDPSRANYAIIPDLSIYDDCEGVKAYNTIGRYTSDFSSFKTSYENLQNRNFFFYSLFKAAPVLLQPAVYDDGSYYASAQNTTVDQQFLDSYSVLVHMKDITEITDEETDTFLMMSNKTTHEDIILQMPDYELSLHVDNSGFFKASFYVVDGVKAKMTNGKQGANGSRFGYYCTNMVSFLELGKWFDWMRENGVYDNTRIILVSDHGHKLGQFSNLKHKGIADIEMFDCLLMMKDFGASGLVTSQDFMTNADTPVMAMEGLIENPVNPFTGKAITSKEKTAHPQLVTTSKKWRVDDIQDATTFQDAKANWLAFDPAGDITDPKSWAVIGNWAAVTKLLEEEGAWP